MIGVGALAIVLGLGSNCPGPSPKPSPQVYRVSATASGAGTYNILFLGAGFDSDEDLKSYRQAVQKLSDGIMTNTDMPYSSYKEHLSMWRIDVRSAPLSASTCPSDCTHTEVGPPSATPVPTPPQTVNPSGPAVVDQELGVSLCYTSALTVGSCLLVWASADGQKAAADLAADAGNIDVVVIVANTQLEAGATVQAALSASQSLIVIGVPPDQASGFPTAVHILGHELAHAIGLADEYTAAVGISSTSASLFPNIWQPADGCYAPQVDNALNAASGSELNIPWHDYLLCEKGISPELDCNSNGDKTDYGCPRVWWPYHDLPSCPGVTTGMDDGCLDTTGLYEGAYYTKSGIYRSANTCKMLDRTAPFCEVCKDLIDKFFECNFVHPGTCP